MFKHMQEQIDFAHERSVDGRRGLTNYAFWCMIWDAYYRQMFGDDWL